MSTGETKDIMPLRGAGDPKLRFNWNAALSTDPFEPDTVYLGSQFVHESSDRGETWTPISPDLTRQTDRNTLPVMGRIWSPEAVAQHQSTANRQ